MSTTPFRKPAVELVRFVGLMLVPSAAGRAHAAHRALTVVTATIEPVVNSDPRTNPPHLGGTATFRVLWSPNPGPCSQVTAKMTVTGPNAQVKTDSTMSLMSYTGSKAGIDTVKFTFSKSVCAGLPDFTIVVSGNDTFNVGWGQDAWQMGLCSTHHPYPSRTFGICAPPVVTVTDPRGNTWTDTYSVDGQLVSARDALGNTASWS